MLESTIRIVFCALTRFFAFGRRMGFIRIFLLAPATTAVVMFPVLLPPGPLRRVEWAAELSGATVILGTGTCIPY
jgi:hypothetical protein